MREPEDKVAEISIIIFLAVLLLLKFTGILPISWLAITAIIWIPFFIGIILTIGMLLILLTQKIIEWIKEKKYERN